MTPSAATARAVFRDAFARPVINAATARPPTSTAVRKAGTKVAERSSRTKAQSAVAATAAPSARRGDPFRTVPPEEDAAHANQRANRRSQRDRVIGMDDSLGEAEDRACQ